MSMWIDVDVALAEVPVNLIALVDASTGKVVDEGVTYNEAGLDLIWHFTTTAGATTATVVTPTTGGDYDWAHQDGGMYTIEIPASGGVSANNDTEGFGYFTGNSTANLPWRGPTIGFRVAETNDVMIDGTDSPATQSQLNQIANVSGSAKRAPTAYTLTTGVQSANTVAATEELDGTRHEHTDDAGVLDLYYEFNIGSGLPSEVKVTGYLQGNNDDLEVYGYDWASSTFKRIGTLSGQASSNNVVNTFDLLIDMVGSGANEGLVRVQFKDGAFTLTNATLAIDQILVEFTVGVEGYEGGAVWLDTNASNTGTVRGVDGIASNPVSTIAAANTLLTKTGLSRIEVAPQSNVTLAVTQANQQFNGKNWTLALAGKSVSGSYIQGADISGIGTGASEIHFDHCHFANVTLPPCDCEDCVFEGTFTIGTAGDFKFEGCMSGIAGTSTPVFDFGGALNASNVNFRDYSGGIEIKNMGAGSGLYNMSLEGDGQLIINANCSATSTIAVRGHFPLSGDSTAIAAITFSDDARFHHKPELAAIVADTNELQTDWIDGGRLDLLLDAIPTAAMRGTDGAYTGTPPTAGAIADQVWEEAIADHSTGTTFGGKNQRVVPSETAGDYKATGFAVAGNEMALVDGEDVYHADIQLTIDEDNTQDEYTVIWYKNGVAITSGITDPKIQVVKRADGTDLIAEVAMTEIGSTETYKYDEDTNRVTAGEAVVGVVTATIDTATRTWKRVLGRDSE